MAKPAHRKLIGNHKLILGILVAAFRDQMPFGDLETVTRQHLDAIGRGEATSGLIGELIRRDFVSEANIVMTSASKFAKPLEGATHSLDPKGLNMILCDYKETDVVLARGVIRWLAILNNMGDLPENFEENLAKIDDLGKKNLGEELKRFREERNVEREAA